jgi:hypothetical protein
MITRHEVAARLSDYLHHRLSLQGVVDWAENAMMEGELEEADFDLLRDVVSRLGVADVRAFGLTWEDCESFLTRLGYRVKVEVSASS